jgi:hypothetical protein
MSKFSVYELDLTGAFRQVGPKRGFRVTTQATAWAMSEALVNVDDYKLYIVAGGSDIVVVFPSALLAVRVLENKHGEDRPRARRKRSSKEEKHREPESACEM